MLSDQLLVLIFNPCNSTFLKKSEETWPTSDKMKVSATMTLNFTTQREIWKLKKNSFVVIYGNSLRKPAFLLANRAHVMNRGSDSQNCHKFNSCRDFQELSYKTIAVLTFEAPSRKATGPLKGLFHRLCLRLRQSFFIHSKGKK